MEVELAFFDQAERELVVLARHVRQRAEVLEALRDQLPEAHDVGGVALAQIEQRDVVAAADLDQAGAARRVVQGLADGCVQCAGHAAELFDGQPLHFFQHAGRVCTLCVTEPQRMS